MPQTTSLPLLLAPILLAAACSPASRSAPEPILPEPVFNKLGDVTQCVAPDGRVFAPVVGAGSPCRPSDCIEGYVSVNDVFVCADKRDPPRDDDRGDPPPRVPPGDPETPPPARPGGLTSVPPTSN